MQTINLVATSDKYTDACTLIEYQADQIGYAVANQPAFMQTLGQGKDVLEENWSPEFYRPPETNTLLRCAGVRFRSAIPGKPATIVVQSITPADSAPGPGVPFTGTLSPSGSVTPGASSVQVQKDGVLVAQEPILDILTGKLATGGLLWDMADDAPNTRVTMRALGPPLIDLVAGDALPVPTVDGFTISLYPNKTTFPGVIWSFRYNLAAAQWQWMGGYPYFINIQTSEATASGAFVNLATVGPQITIPRNGTYLVEWGFGCGGDNSGANCTAELFRNGADMGVGCSTQDVNAAGGIFTAQTGLQIAGFGLGDILLMKYNVSNGLSTHFFNRWLKVSPLTLA